MSSTTGGMKNYKAVKRNLDKIQEASETVIKRTTADVKKHAPSWVASEVVKVYGVKKSEINNGKIGKVEVKGDNVKNVTIKYSGRLLTPTHFGMTPKTPKASYILKASILREKKATLGKVRKLTKKQRAALGKNFRNEGTQNSDHSPIMLIKTGAASEEKTQYIPFQRKSKDRNKLEVIKTVSLPQMVSGERTHEGITKALNEGLGKRLDHHMKLLNK